MSALNKHALLPISHFTGIFREVKADVDLGKGTSFAPHLFLIGYLNDCFCALHSFIRRHAGIDDVILPKGTNIVINLYALQRKREIWGEDADQFRPERFHATNEANERHNYLPFAGGIRTCIGENEAF